MGIVIESLTEKRFLQLNSWFLVALTLSVALFPEKSLSSTRISFEALFNESPARHSSHSTRLLQSFNFVLFNVSLKAFYLTLAVIFLDSFIVSFVFVEDYGEDDELSDGNSFSLQAIIHPTSSYVYERISLHIPHFNQLAHSFFIRF